MMINTERMVKEFCSLVEIDSLSFQEERMIACMKEKLAEFQAAVEEDEHGNLYVFIPGELKGEPLLFSSHMDTVEPGIGKKAVVHSDGRITSQGNTVLGADDLAGVVSILEALRGLKEEGIAHRSVEILLTVAEEIYLEGSRRFDYSKVKAKEAYVLDLSGPIGTAAVAAPTLVSFQADFTGRAAHAGFSPEEGINAIQMAARALSSVSQGRIDGETTVNIGTIKGGLARNIVSETCCLKGEIRSLSHKKALQQSAAVESAFKEAVARMGGILSYTTTFGCIAYQVDTGHPVVRRFEKACQTLSLPTQYEKTFGGSDNNVFMQHDITGIVMACGMHQVHSTKEYTTISDLEACASVVRLLMTSEV